MTWSITSSLGHTGCNRIDVFLGFKNAIFVGLPSHVNVYVIDDFEYVWNHPKYHGTIRTDHGTGNVGR